MDFDLTRPVFRLVFDVPEYAGLVVRARSAGAEELATIAELAESQTITAVRALIAAFGGLLVSWNAEQDGEPIPATVEGLRRLDYASLLVIVRAWLDAVAGRVKQFAPPPAIDEAELPMDFGA
jgi:hypothetical protein